MEKETTVHLGDAEQGPWLRLTLVDVPAAEPVPGTVPGTDEPPGTVVAAGGCGGGRPRRSRGPASEPSSHKLQAGVVTIGRARRATSSSTIPSSRAATPSCGSSPVAGGSSSTSGATTARSSTAAGSPRRCSTSATGRHRQLRVPRQRRHARAGRGEAGGRAGGGRDQCLDPRGRRAHSTTSASHSKRARCSPSSGPRAPGSRRSSVP